MLGSVMMILSGLFFYFLENFWLLLFAATVGVISVTGGDFGPFRSIEESILSQLTGRETRSDVLAWYVTMGTLGTSAGSELGGRLVHWLQNRGWEDVKAYHVLFLLYTLMGVVNVVCVLSLGDACELGDGKQGGDYARVAQDDREDRDSGIEMSSTDNDRQPRPASPLPLQNTGLASKVTGIWSTFSASLTTISRPTLITMGKLWLLLALDSLADGMVPWTLTVYFLDTKFSPSKSTLGDTTSLAYFLGTLSSLFAGPLARKIGLINTMVFTHIPSSASVVVFPFPSHFWAAALCLMVRAGLNNMDQAPRSAFIAAVVKPSERTAVLGITSMSRTLVATAGPTVTGWLSKGGRFWVAFVIAGVCRLIYDAGLWVLFVNMKLYEHEGGDGTAGKERGSDEEQFDLVAGDEIADSFQLEDDSEEEEKQKHEQREKGVAGRTGGGSSNMLDLPRGLQRVRSRSPHQRQPSFQ